MKISEKFQQAARENRVVWSFEYFPPRTAQGLQNLYDRIERMRELGPEFIDITWGAGGKSSDLTLNLVQTCQETIGMETCMHLCCTEMPTDKVKESLRVAKEHGCQNILALRGDPPNGQSTWEPTPGGFSRAIDLVKYIRAEYGDYFDIAVAGFPQGHPETPEGEDAKRLELQYLKEKIDAGANFIFTQMFYDVDIFVDWVKRVRNAGITVPIVPGIMPIQSWQKFQTWVKRENIVVPPHFYEVLNPVQENDEQVRAVGTKLVAEMCNKILDAGLGIQALHIYTLNLEKGARMLIEEIGLEARREQIQPLPWRPSLTPARRTETIRPIFWANRTQSYLSRTEDWDEFPNGRWGDSRSPAYGDLDGYPVKIDVKHEDGLALWGEPQTFQDVCHLFARFCRNEIHALPWSSQPPSRETSIITQQLAKMNELGYLTINSQPAVDGARSDDPTHGWGPKNGYVYQKAYLEFFVSPELLNDLVRRIEKDPRITYYAVNKRGDLRTNTHSEGPNAVTWGVFPGKEVIQPTIVEAVSFIAWKDEAFELGMKWSYFYEEGSPSRKLIQDIMDNSYLVNIVANDFKDGLSIFEPFQLDCAVLPAPAKTVSNGISQVVEAATATTTAATAAVANGISKAKDTLTNGVNGHHAVESDQRRHSIFRPCIDLHNGVVKQIVGGTLQHDEQPNGDAQQDLKTNFVSEHPPSYYANLYKSHNLTGGHVIKLGLNNDAAAMQALRVWPNAFQVGGGIDEDNAQKWINVGAAKVIVTSYLFPEGKFALERLQRLSERVGKDKLVVDLSCRKQDDRWIVAMNKWTKLTDMEVNKESIALISKYCSELLIHAADVEGLCNGIDQDLVRCLGRWTDIPCTYAGGAKDISDLELVDRLSQGKIDLTFGSALDIFGGSGVKFEELVKVSHANVQKNPDYVPPLENGVKMNSNAADDASPIPAGPEPKPRQKKTLADLDDIFDSSPIFMRKAPEPGEENEALDALKSLIFEGSGDEIATNLKNQGTECHQEGKLREALTFYTQGLEAKPEDPKLRESLLLNRSACNLSLGNYRSVLRDTAEIISNSPKLVKPYFRAASALLALQRWDDAIDCIRRGQSLESEQTEEKQKTWIGLEQKAKNGMQKDTEREERQRRDRVGKEQFRRALIHRGIIQVKTNAPPANPSEAHFEEREETLPLSSNGLNGSEKWYPPALDHPVIFPAFLLYPQHSMSDLISAFHEDTTFEDQLEVMFPKTQAGDANIPWAEWDSKREYFADNLAVYAETKAKKLLKVGRGLTLRDVAKKAAGLSKADDESDGLVMQDGLLSFIVLPKGEAERSWVDQYKRARDGQ